MHIAHGKTEITLNTVIETKAAFGLGGNHDTIDAKAILEASPRGISVVTGPNGAVISDELRDDEGILYADIDLGLCVEPKQIHDVTGGYNRFDIFQLNVSRTANRPIRFTCDEIPENQTTTDNTDNTDRKKFVNSTGLS